MPKIMIAGNLREKWSGITAVSQAFYAEAKGVSQSKIGQVSLAQRGHFERYFTPCWLIAPGAQ